MVMYRCICCGFKGIYENVRTGASRCPVCGYSRGRTEPSADNIAIAKRILRISPKLPKREFPFEFGRVALVKRAEVLAWLTMRESAARRNRSMNGDEGRPTRAD